MEVSTHRFRLVSRSRLAAAAAMLLAAVSVMGATAGSAYAAKPRPPRATPTPVPTAVPAPAQAAPTAPVLRLGSTTGTITLPGSGNVPAFTVVWDPSVDSVTGSGAILYQYTVYVNGVLRGISDTCAYCFGTTSYTLPIPPAGQSVRVVVVASLGNLVSPPSNEFVFTSPGASAVAPPTAPIVRLGSVTNTSVSFVWDSSVDSVTGQPQLYLYTYALNGVPQGTTDTCAYCLGTTGVTVPRPASGQSVRISVTASTQGNSPVFSNPGTEFVYTAP